MPVRLRLRTRLALAALVGVAAVPLALLAYRARAQESETARLRPVSAPILPSFGGFGGAGGAEPEPARPTVAYVVPPVSAKAAKTWEKLNAVVSLNFANETPLEDVLKVLREMSKGPHDKGLSFYIDPIALQEAEKTNASPVTLDLDDVPLATGLALMLRQLHLKFYVHPEGFVMIVGEDEEEHLSEPFKAVLDELSDLRAEVAELRKLLGDGRREPYSRVPLSRPQPGAPSKGPGAR
jgi:hypothetical protein